MNRSCGFSEFYHGVPCADWLRVVMNRIDPDLFAACFSSWVAECWPNQPDLVAIDGKTLGDDTTKRSVTRGTQRAATVLRALGITSFDPPMPPQQGQTIVE